MFHAEKSAVCHKAATEQCILCEDHSTDYKSGSPQKIRHQLTWERAAFGV